MDAIANKKIRKEARRNNLNILDLKNAIRAIRYQKASQYTEADFYKSEILNDEPRLWEVAGDVNQFMSDLGATSK